MPTLPTFNPKGQTFSVPATSAPATLAPPPKSAGFIGTSIVNTGVVGGAQGGFVLTPTPAKSAFTTPVFSPPPQPLVKPPVLEPVKPVFSPPVKPLPLPVPLEPAKLPTQQPVQQPPVTDASFRKGGPLPELPKQVITSEGTLTPPLMQPPPEAPPQQTSKADTTRPLPTQSLPTQPPELKLPTPSGQVLTNDRVLTSSTVSAPLSLPKNLSPAGDSQTLLMSAIAAAGVGYFTYKEKGATVGAVLAIAAFLGVQKILSMKGT